MARPPTIPGGETLHQFQPEKKETHSICWMLTCDCYRYDAYCIYIYDSVCMFLVEGELWL